MIYNGFVIVYVQVEINQMHFDVVLFVLMVILWEKDLFALHVPKKKGIFVPKGLSKCQPPSFPLSQSLISSVLEFLSLAFPVFTYDLFRTATLYNPVSELEHFKKNTVSVTNSCCKCNYFKNVIKITIQINYKKKGHSRIIQHCTVAKLSKLWIHCIKKKFERLTYFAVFIMKKPKRN